MIVIKAKTASGVIQDIRVAEVIEIDGKPWHGQASPDGLSERVAHLEGSVEALMRAVFEAEEITDG